MSEPILPTRIDDHYWIVAGDESRLWSSARGAYVAAADATYAAWRDAGGVATRIASEAELDAVARRGGARRARPQPAAAASAEVDDHLAHHR